MKGNQDNKRNEMYLKKNKQCNERKVLKCK